MGHFGHAKAAPPVDRRAIRVASKATSEAEVRSQEIWKAVMGKIAYDQRRENPSDKRPSVRSVKPKRR